MNTPNPGAEQRPNPETPPDHGPRIYVASLSDYNAGRLHGTWLDATADADEMNDGITTMLAASPEPNAEEWAIHDFEGWGPLRLSEYESIDTIARLADGIATHGMAFAHWAALVGTDADELERFDAAYLGHWPSVEDYARDYLDDCGLDRIIEEHVPDSLQPYVTVDVDGFARDLEYSGDITASEGDDGVYLYASC